MITAELPGNEAERIKALNSYMVLDTDPEPIFDHLTYLAAHISGAPISLVSLVASERQWFKSRHGTELVETGRDISFCGHTILQAEPLIVPDASLDPRFSDNPLVVGDDHIRFYAGFPIFASSGHTLGSLCVIASEPQTLTEDEVSVLTALATQVEVHLELGRSRHQEQTTSSTRSELLNHLDRELHTTLNGIVSAQHFLSSTQLDPAQRDLQFSSQATDHMIFLIEHLKTLLTLSPSKLN